MAIATNVEESIKRFVDLATANLRLQAVYLFGSNAKGRTHEWSDIDLAIVSSDFSGDSFDDSKMLFPYILKVDSAIEVHPFRPEDFSAEILSCRKFLIREFVSTEQRFCENPSPQFYVATRNADEPQPNRKSFCIRILRIVRIKNLMA